MRQQRSSFCIGHDERQLICLRHGADRYTHRARDQHRVHCDHVLNRILEQNHDTVTAHYAIVPEGTRKRENMP